MPRIEMTIAETSRLRLALDVATEPTRLGDLVRPDRVHRRIYLDENVFREEMERIFYTTWVYVGHESEVHSAGDYKTTHIGLQPVIVARHEDGQIFVMLNRCTHRAATVCQEPAGNSSYFRCEYHGWLYKNNGELLQPTFGGGYDDRDFVKSDFALARAPRVDTYRGMIFASLAASGPTLREHLGNAAQFIDLAFDIAPDGNVLLSAGRQLYSYAGNWKLQSENGVDGYHPNFVHKTFLESVGRPSLMQVFGAHSDARAGALGGGHGLLDSRPMLREAAAMRLRSPQGRAALEALTLRIGDRDRAAEVLASAGTQGFNLLIFPNVLMIGNQIRVIHPRSVLATDVEMYPYMLGGATPEQNEARLRVHEDFYGAAGGGGPDDVEMFRRVFEGLNAKGFPSAEWLVFARGLRRSVIEHGIEWGHVTDENPQRGFYRQWRQMMDDSVGAAV
jgi:phenylpropionate dioxygenase-like ring-hydroxylating dioxygenase large terminal subunit